MPTRSDRSTVITSLASLEGNVNLALRRALHEVVYSYDTDVSGMTLAEALRARAARYVLTAQTRVALDAILAQAE